MPTRPRILLSVLLAALALGLVAGCGGGGEPAGAGTDVDELLRDTFAGGNEVESGRLDASLAVTEGGAPELSVKLGGPFQSTGEGRLPKLALHAVLAAHGQTVEGGVTSTGDQGFVNLDGTDYELAGPVFAQLEARYEEAAKGSSGRSPADLGIDPRRWLVDARNAGESKVGDTDTVRITGDVDVPRLLDDVDRALGRLRALGVAGAGRLPQGLTDEQKRRAADAVRDVEVEIDTGADDRILRRLVVSLRAESPTGGRTADVRLALTLLEVNEDQDIEAPEDARPFGELASELEGLGIGGLGSAPGSGSGPGKAKLERYSRCIRDAAGDEAELRRCADLLTTP